MRGLKITPVSSETGGYEAEQEGTVAPWLKQFAKAQNDTIVQQARRRNQAAGYLDHVKNILVNRPRYATVEDAVNDFRKRTGLDSYLEEIKQSEAKSKPIQKKSVASRMNTLAKMGLKKKVKQAAEPSALPKSLAKYTEAAPDIERFVRNRVDTLHGLGLSVPQLQQGILDMFGIRNGVQDGDVYNDEVGKWLSDQIEGAQNLANKPTTSPELGSATNKEDFQEDSDAFAGLMPASQY